MENQDERRSAFTTQDSSSFGTCQHSMFESIPVPSFSGEQGEDVESFVTTFRECAMLDGWSEEVQKIRLHLCLRAHARSWYLSNQVEFDATAVRISDILTQLVDWFVPPHLRFVAKIQLRERSQQQGESVTDYACSLIMLERKARANLSTTQLANLFLIGLLPPLRAQTYYQLQIRDPTIDILSSVSFDTVLSTARLFESSAFLMAGLNCNQATVQMPSIALASNCGAEVKTSEVVPVKHVSKPRKPCPLCNGQHWSSRCPERRKLRASHL